MTRSFFLLSTPELSRVAGGFPRRYHGVTTGDKTTKPQNPKTPNDPQWAIPHSAPSMSEYFLQLYADLGWRW